MKVLDLFSGIGGFSLGLERAGFQTAAFCEIDPFCQKVLRKHWPNVPIYTDVRKLTSKDIGAVDVICGGFPCQDISYAGTGAGIEGSRSGLWSEFARLIGEIRPRFVIVENVSALLNRGLSRVLGDLSEIGYDAEWTIIRAYDVGIPQARPRVWIVAYPTRQSCSEIFYQNPINASSNIAWVDATCLGDANLNDKNCRESTLSVLGDTNGTEIPNRERSGTNERLSRGMDRYRGLGNCVVPQISQMIGEAIKQMVEK